MGALIGMGMAEVAARMLQLVPPELPKNDTAIVLHYTDPNGLIHLTPNWKGYVAYTWTEISPQGFRDRTFAPEPPVGTVRIAVLGDSYMMGDGAAQEKTCAKQLEALLSSRHQVEVMNCGVSATNTQNQLKILEEVLRDYRPHMVALSYNVNDFCDYRETRFERLSKAGHSYVVQADGRVTMPVEAGSPERAKLWVRNRSYLYRWLSSVKDSWLASGESRAGDDKPALVQRWIDGGGAAKSFAALGKMKELCDQERVAFFVFIIPSMIELPGSVQSMNDYPYYEEHEIMHEHMTDLGIAFVDLLPEFAGLRTRQLRAHKFDPHYSAYGNEIIARALLKELEPEIAKTEQRLAERGSWSRTSSGM